MKRFRQSPKMQPSFCSTQSCFSLVSGDRVSTDSLTISDTYRTKTAPTHCPENAATAVPAFWNSSDLQARELLQAKAPVESVWDSGTKFPSISPMHRPCVQRQGTLPSPPPQPKTPIIAVASTMRATPRNVTITPTPTQDTHHCRSIDHVCNVKERYHHPPPQPKTPIIAVASTMRATPRNVTITPHPNPKTPIIAVASTMRATPRNVTITPTPTQETPIIAVESTMRATPRNVTITPTPTQDTHHCRSIDHVCNVKERYHHPHPNPKTPIIAVASTMRATPRNVTITPTPTQDTHHCRSIDHACNAKERYHHPHPNPRHPSLP